MALGPHEVLLTSKHSRLADEIEGMVNGKLKGMKEDKENYPERIEAKCEFNLKGFSDEEGILPDPVAREVYRRYRQAGWSNVKIIGLPKEKGSYTLILEY